MLKPGGSLVLCDILISDEFKHDRPHFCEQNMVSSLDEYRRQYERVDFSEVRITDATRECWEAFYWDIVRFAHQKLLDGVISKEEIGPLLSRTYMLAADLKYYVLVGATK